MPLRDTTDTPSSAASPSYGELLTFTATVAPGGSGAPVPGGTVQFLVDRLNVGLPVNLAGGSASSPRIAPRMRSLGFR